MSIRTYKPTSPSRRAMTNSTFGEITTSTPEKSLLVSLSKSGGRNNQGKITCRHIGGGHKRKYRVIDFKRNKDGIPAVVKTIEYDPNRNARICLLSYSATLMARRDTFSHQKISNSVTRSCLVKKLISCLVMPAYLKTFQKVH